MNRLRSYLHRVGITVMLVVMVSSLIIGCATEKKLTTTTTTERRIDSSENNEVVIDKEVVVEKESKGDFSVIGATFNVIGEIVALPFRLIGGLVDFIF